MTKTDPITIDLTGLGLKIDLLVIVNYLEFDF